MTPQSTFARAILTLALTVAPLTVAMTAPARALDVRPAPSPNVTDAHIEAVVRTYLLENPAFVLDVIRKAKLAEQEAAQVKRLSDIRSFLSETPNLPGAGGTAGDTSITVVEFFDYRCLYCAASLPAIKRVLAQEQGRPGDFLDLPLLGPSSNHAAAAGLAGWDLAPDRYMALHKALMTGKGRLDRDQILRLAEQAGYDKVRLSGQMESPDIRERIKSLRSLAAQTSAQSAGPAPRFVSSIWRRSSG